MKQVFLILLLCHLQCLSAVEYYLNEAALHVNARDLSLGGLVCDLEANPTDNLECTYLMPYQLKELSVRKLCVSLKRLGLEWTVGWVQSGNMDWMENTMRLHIGKKLNQHLQVGAEFDVLLQADATENKAAAYFAQVDCRYELSSFLAFGLTIINPSGAPIRAENVEVPLGSAAFLATRIAPAKGCSIYAEVGVWLNQRAQERIGLEWSLSDTFILRTGVSTKPVMPSWGLGGKLRRLHYSWGGNIHPILGMSNGFTLNYNW